MVLSFFCLAVRAVLGALVRSRRGLDALLVLRHELAILRRQFGIRSLTRWPGTSGRCVPPSAGMMDELVEAVAVF